MIVIAFVILFLIFASMVVKDLKGEGEEITETDEEKILTLLSDGKTRSAVEVMEDSGVDLPEVMKILQSSERVKRVQLSDKRFIYKIKKTGRRGSD